VFLSASAQGGRERNEAAYGWWITTPDMKPISWGNSTLASSVKEWQTVALLQAMLEAVPNVPAGGTFTLSRNSRNRSQIC